MPNTTFVVPAARTAELVTTTTDDAVLVYDQHTHRLHHLNESAALVWSVCDGLRSVAMIADATGLAEALVRVTVADLGEAGLLDGVVPSDIVPAGSSRRAFMRRLKVAGVVAVPAIISVSAPAATAAASVAGQCWWFSDITSTWTSVSHSVTDRADCQRQDSCHPGGGHESIGGACFKWTVGANDPFVAW